MSEIKGIYAASLSILDENLALNVDKTIKHAESLGFGFILYVLLFFFFISCFSQYVFSL